MHVKHDTVKLWPVLIGGIALLLLAPLAAGAAPAPAAPFGAAFEQAAIQHPGSPTGSPNASFTDPQDAMAAIAGRIADLQSDITEDNAGNGTPPGESPADGDNGGWEWQILTSSPHHTGGLSYSNLYGPIAKGMAYGYRHTGDARYETALLDARDGWRLGYYTGDIATDGVNFAQNALIEALVIHAETTGNPAHADSARFLWDHLLADGYNGWAGGGTAEQWAQHLFTRRAGQGIAELAPWDVNIYIEAANALDRAFPGQGYDQDALDMGQEIFDQIPGTWDPADTTTSYWVYGKMGAMHAYATTGIQQTAMEGLKDDLVALPYDAYYGGQGTAYMLMAFADYPPGADQTGVADFVEGGVDYLLSVVDPNGNVDWGGDMWPEETAEVLSGLFETSGTVGPQPAGDCLSTVNTPVVVPMVLDRPSGALPEVRGYSITFTLSGPIQATAITEDTFLSSVSGTHYEVVGTLPGKGPFTIDDAILGGTCGAAGGGTLFNITIEDDNTTDGAGIITVNSTTLRDCANAPIASVAATPTQVVTVDETAPAAIAALATSQVKSGNDTDGTTQITVTWPAVETDATVAVYRQGYGDYPEYDDGTGAVPDPGTAPGGGWTATAVTASGQTDETTSRDFWYYVGFVTDTCGNVSTVSNLAGGTLNYHLGDVTDGVTPGQGDNDVGTDDISALAASYASTLVFNDPVNYLDVGPTTDFSVDARPTTDDVVDFEDLMMFAINFGMVSMTEPPAGLEDVPGGQARLELVTEALDGERTRLHLLLADNPGNVKGIHAVVRLAGAELESVEQGALLDAQGNEVFFTHLPEAGAGVHTALLGQGVTIHGQGEVATLVVRGRGGAAAQLVLADLRDLDNRFLGDPPPATTGIDSNIEAALGAPLPERYELLGAVPNPFNPSTTISFRLPQETAVSLRIFDVGGRYVQTLVHGLLPAGEHGVTWNGRDHRGRPVGSGVYLYTIEAGELHAVEKLVLLK